jgi:hypothetical protein
VAKPHFDWKRFWTPLGESEQLNNGYLLDPDGKIFNRNALPLSRLSDQRCLALLGEPGMGKTTAMEDTHAELQHGAVSAGEAFLWLDLRICGTDTAVERKLFDTQEFKSWRNGACTLNLFLDGFDECVLRVGVLVPLLLGELGPADLSKLRLRIACRTAEWPKNLSEGLARLYGKDFHVYELAPLRRIDVSRAAETYGLDVERFMTAVDRSEAIPFATKPVTLHMLLARFKRSRELPSDLAGLYEEGCEALCEEGSETRTGRTTVSARQRVHIARKIAGIMALCQRTSILRHGGSSAAEPSDLTIDDILDTAEREKTEDGESEMTPSAVKEVLNTGLFSGRGSERLGWAHQTYSEFLASEYLQAHRFAPEQIVDLLMHPQDRSRVVPQLHGVAAWLAGKSQEVFDRICATDPRVLLAADIATLDDDRKGRLLDSFLGQIEARSDPFEWDERRHFRRLKHGGLATRLRPYVEGGSWSTWTRQVAIMIAEECDAKDLQELLIKIALDTAEGIDVRIYAVAAIGNIADQATKLRLRPLAEGDPTDHDDRLKGEALAALRGVLSSKELFGFLSAPAKSYHGSAYWRFAHDLTRDLAVEDLPDALEWAARFPSQIHHYHFAGARDAIVRSAHDHLALPAVMTAFADFARARMKIWEPIWNRDVPLPEGIDRKRLVQAIIDGECAAAPSTPPTPSPSSELDWWQQMTGESPLVRPEDLGWVVERLLSAEPGSRAGWAELLQVMVNVCMGAHSIDPVIEAAERVPELHDLLPNTLGSIEVASDKARQLKEQARAREPRPSTRRREGPSLAERMALRLSQCRHDVANAFPNLVHHMAFGDEQTDAVDPWSRRLHEFPGWRDADAPTRRTILDLGKEYLNSLDVEPLPRTGREFTIPWPVRAAQLTLGLFDDVEPEWLSQSTSIMWQRWATIVVDLDEIWTSQPTKLLDRVLDKAPDEAIVRFVALIDWEDRIHQSASIARRLARFWSPRVEQALLALARSAGRAPSTVGELLDILLSKGSRDGLEYARSLLASPLPDESRTRDLAREAAVALLVHKPVLGWQRVWPIVTNHPELGREIAIRIAVTFFPRREGPWTDALAPGDLADLYLWLCKEFPRSEDPVKKGGAIGGREQVADLRDSLLIGLSNRATSAAVEELTRISTHSGTPDMRYLIAQARQKLLEASWTSPTPQQLLLMARNHQKRWVESALGLREVVLQSLARYQGELRGELPAVQDLWSERSRKVWRPKPEDAISNHIARHLRRDLTERGVIVNREVQIRFSPDGQRTDIHVDAVRHRRGDDSEALLKVIIEVKGSWNKSLKTAMQEQLRDKYLKENDCRHGIYLVAWFNCKDWDARDPRCRDAKAWRWNLEEARAQLDSQAKSLSNDQCSLAAFVLDTGLG